MIVRFIGATSPYSQIRGLCFCCQLQETDRYDLVMNGLVGGVFGGRSCPRTHLFSLPQRTQTDTGAGHPARDFAQFVVFHHPMAIPNTTSQACCLFLKTSNKTLDIPCQSLWVWLTPIGLQRATVSERESVRVSTQNKDRISVPGDFRPLGRV